MTPSPRRLVSVGTGALILGTAMITALAAASIANHASWHHVDKAKRATKVVVVTGEKETTIFENDWQNIPGAKTLIRVPSGEQALLTIRFTAETACFHTGIEYCSLRVLVDGRQARPASGRDFHIDSRYGGENIEAQKGRAMDRSLRVGPGRYTVKVQGVGMGDTGLWVDDWSLIVKRVAT